jgi:diguanylate cyclase (GGDEF)-like protein
MGTSSILIVDDDPGAILLLRKVLSDYPTIRFATSGVDALRLAREAPPDLVLLDAEMPGMNGFDVCRELKADPVLVDVPVLFVTAHDDLAFETRALTLGAADFITKPLSAPRVLLRVELHLKLKRQVDLLRALATTDPLTGVANRRAVDEALVREWGRSARRGSCLSALMVDVDCFKGFNDTYGHPAGDGCLRSVARAVAGALRRPGDLVGRYGGEEFLVVLPDTDGVGALAVAEQVCTAVAALRIPHRASRVVPNVTVSVGAASAVGQTNATSGALIEAADRALFDAKRLGRNRVTLAESP